MSGINTEVLKALVTATQTVGFGYVSAVDGKPMLQHQPPLIQVDTTEVDGSGNAKARVTEAAVSYLASLAARPAGSVQQLGTMVTGFIAPAAKKRGNAAGVGAPSKYPFDQLEVGGQFFVGNSEVEKGDAFKTLSATVSSANRKNSEETGETHVVKRAKRGEDRKAILVNGQKVIEEVTEKVRKSLKHFKIVAIEGGVEYGSWKAPENGAMVIRDL